MSTSHTDNHTTTDGRDALWLEAQRRAAAIFGDDQTDAGTDTTDHDATPNRTIATKSVAR